jgi:hypothetical protein
MLIRKVGWSNAAAAVVTLFSARNLSASGPVAYTTQASFDAAAGGLIGPNNFSSIATSPTFFTSPITLDGVTFTDTDGNGEDVTPYANSFYGTPSMGNNRSTALKFTLPANATAFGLYTGEYYNGDSANYSLTLTNSSGSTTLSGVVASGQSAFVGFVSPSGFTSATASYTGGEYSLDNFSVTPEPASLGLLGISAAALLNRRRRIA